MGVDWSGQRHRIMRDPVLSDVDLGTLTNFLGGGLFLRLKEAVMELRQVVELDRLVQHPDLEADMALIANVEEELANSRPLVHLFGMGAVWLFDG